MIPTEEPKYWPWYTRVMFVLIGMIAWPVLTVINLFKYLKRRWDGA